MTVDPLGFGFAEDPSLHNRAPLVPRPVSPVTGPGIGRSPAPVIIPTPANDSGALDAPKRTPRPVGKRLLALLRATLLLPLNILALLTSAKSFRANPVLGNWMLNRLGLHVLRVCLAHGVAQLRWLILAPFVPAVARRRFHRDGYILIENALPVAEFEALKAAINAHDQPVMNRRQGDADVYRVPLDSSLRDRSPAIESASGKAPWLTLQRYVGGRWSKPFFFLELIVNQAFERAADPQRTLHSDTFYPSMKSWLYLHDVPADQAPFVFVPGSHRLTWKRIQFEYRRSLSAARDANSYSAKGSFRVDAETLAALGYGDEVAMAVKANTLLIANTYGFHRRGDCAPGAGPVTRLALWSYFRPGPFNPWPGPSLPGLHWLIERAYAPYVSLKNAWLRRQGKRPPWSDVPAARFQARNPIAPGRAERHAFETHDAA